MFGELTVLITKFNTQFYVLFEVMLVFFHTFAIPLNNYWAFYTAESHVSCESLILLTLTMFNVSSSSMTRDCFV